jgi:hypothetical protein
MEYFLNNPQKLFFLDETFYISKTFNDYSRKININEKQQRFASTIYGYRYLGRL